MDEDRVALWTMIGVLCGFKLLTALLVFIMMPSLGSAIFLLIFHWFWFVPPILVGVGISMTWLRLVRGRAKRKRLRRAEFSLD